MGELWKRERERERENNIKYSHTAYEIVFYRAYLEEVDDIVRIA